MKQMGDRCMDEIMDPKRHLDLEGADNVRDLGGYRTRDGRSTRWQRFLRADSLHRLSPADEAVLLDYGVQIIIDLRRTEEIEKEPNVFARSPAVEYHHLDFFGDENLEFEPLPEGTESSRRHAHDHCSCLDKCQVALGRILGALADEGNQATLFHCASGKDRTGLISVLLLGLAGVPEETVAADYSLTARYMLGYYLALPDADPEIRTWMDFEHTLCPPETILLVMDHLERNYGGVEGYLQTVGLSGDKIDQLRDRLVE